MQRHRPPTFRINRQSILGSGLVFAGLGGGASTNLYADASGYGNNGTLTAMDASTDWLWDSTLGRWCTDFDGSNDIIRFPQLALQPPISFHAWINLAAVNRYGAVTATGNMGATANNGAMLQARATGAIGVGYGSGATEAPNVRRLLYSANTLYAAGEWVPVCGIIHALGNSMSLYVRGVNVSGTYSGDYAGAIGYDGQPGKLMEGNNAFVIGKLSDPLIYSRALSAAEIAQLADPSNVMLSGLILPPKRRIWAAVTAAPPAETLVAGICESEWVGGICESGWVR